MPYKKWRMGKGDIFLVEHYQHTTCLNKDEDIYRTSLELLFSGCYTFAIQERQSGIEDMKLEDYPKLMGYGHAMSDIFKAARVYGDQLVTLASERKPEIICYSVASMRRRSAKPADSIARGKT